MDDVNRCVICGVDIGACNPRQLCCKTYCPMENIDGQRSSTLISDANDQVSTQLEIDRLLQSEVFTSMEASPYFIFGDREPHLIFLRKIADHLSIIPNHKIIIAIDQVNPIIIDDGESWTFFRYPFSVPGTILYQWNMIIVNLLSVTTHTWWVRNFDVLTINLKKH